MVVHLQLRAGAGFYWPSFHLPVSVFCGTDVVEDRFVNLATICAHRATGRPSSFDAATAGSKSGLLQASGLMQCLTQSLIARQ